MHLSHVRFHPEKYPTDKKYPLNLKIFHQTPEIKFNRPVTLFVGENGTGKSTLLEAMAKRCNIHIWRDAPMRRVDKNPYENLFYRFISIAWKNGPVPGSYFGSSIFEHFAKILDEWATMDPGQLEDFGGKSLISMSHGQSLMAFFENRYRIKGLYLLDEPETALSPKSQIRLLEIINQMSTAGHAQFIIATHSPLLLACRNAKIFSFDHIPIQPVEYEETHHYQIYKKFMEDKDQFLGR